MTGTSDRVKSAMLEIEQEALNEWLELRKTYGTENIPSLAEYRESSLRHYDTYLDLISICAQMGIDF